MNEAEDYARIVREGEGILVRINLGGEELLAADVLRAAAFVLDKMGPKLSPALMEHTARAAAIVVAIVVFNEEGIIDAVKN